ncbi:class I SAM-dependent methyltransferase [Streptomyces sp. NPDC101213]|uniref:class I SAM-dependent methyltransferase n=1 Tax=Streptomyces sp. NPDC101213 TaxID=3366130 RepID=UPI00381B5248
MNVLHENRTPEYWDRIYQAGGDWMPVTPRERQMFRAYVDPDPSWKAIDVGCGRGSMTAALWVWGMEAVGYDLSPLAIEQARHRNADADVSFVRHDFNASPIPGDLAPGSLGLVVCRASLEFLDRERFLGDVRRWLNPEGVLHITTHIQEKTPPTLRHRGLPQTVVHGLGDGFRSRTRYDLTDDGSVTCLVLRGPQ